MIKHIICVLFLFLFTSVIKETNGYRDVVVNGARTILALNKEKIEVTCKINSPMSYCGFVHPNGKRFSFSGPDLKDGHCSLKRTASKEDDGEWLCHIGKDAAGIEITQRINVRVVDKLAAVQPNISTTHGTVVTLACVTSENKIPLKYCRFEPPTGEAFSINSDIKPEKALQDRYYFPKKMSLDRGDCAVVIKGIKYSDLGVWTCGAAWDDGSEYIDTFYVHVEASTTGVAIGAAVVGIIVAILALVTWKKRHIIGYPRRTEQPIEMAERVNYTRSTPQRSSLASRIIPLVSPRKVVPLVTIQPPSEPSTSPLVR